ncbi:MAG: glycosyltransferase family 4 protein [Nitrospinae bacterium]|nr:glycosyltransferase family 4 protein [Nitrospinota bacterium]
MKVSFVIPFYGANIGGGAENHCRRLAESLTVRGVDVEVLTTTLKDFTSHWNSVYYEAGVYCVNGVTVRRFHPRPVDTDVFVPVNLKIIAGEPITIDEELDYVHNAINSDAMYEFIGNNHKGRLYFFMPYLFGTSLWGSSIVPYKSFLIPCLHDEGYARLEVTKRMFRRVNAALFNSPAEMRLAQNLYGGMPYSEPVLMGEGVDRIEDADGKRFRGKYGMGDTPFILYVGRRDATKNTPLLLEYFTRYITANRKANLNLALIGPGEVDIPEAAAGRVKDLGFVPLEDKKDAYAAATMLCQPSLNESFSLVMMESWWVGRPVLVHKNCEATREHVEKSGGGLAFESFAEFAESVEYILEDPDRAGRMGQAGKAYVESNYTWDIICARFKRFLRMTEELGFDR